MTLGSLQGAVGRGEGEVCVVDIWLDRGLMSKLARDGGVHTFLLGRPLVLVYSGLEEDEAVLLAVSSKLVVVSFTILLVSTDDVEHDGVVKACLYLDDKVSFCEGVEGAISFADSLMLLYDNDSSSTRAA